MMISNPVDSQLAYSLLVRRKSPILVAAGNIDQFTYFTDTLQGDFRPVTRVEELWGYEIPVPVFICGSWTSFKSDLVELAEIGSVLLFSLERE